MKRPLLAASVLTGLLAVTFVVILGARLFREDPALGINDSSLAQAQRNTEITEAAEDLTLAFLDVDYRDMDPRIDAVLDLATGTFKSQYETAKGNLSAAAVQSKATSTGEIQHIGLTKVSAKTATALVAADSTVSNSLITEAKEKGQPVDEKRFYRFQLSLELVKGSWLVNDLQFVQ